MGHYIRTSYYVRNEYPLLQIIQYQCRVITPRTCTRDKVIGRVIAVIVNKNIARSGDLGT